MRATEWFGSLSERDGGVSWSATLTNVATALAQMTWMVAEEAGGGGSSLWTYIAKGREIGAVLILMSIAAVGLIIANAIILRKSYLAPEASTAELEKLLSSKQVDAAIKFCRRAENDSFLTRIVGSGLSKASRSAFGMLELKPALEAAGAREVDRMDRLNHYIAIIAAVGPMLGLLGTVIGMIGAFGEIGGASSGAARSGRLAEFMSYALVTTAMGLVVAIPCTIAYGIFKRRLDGLASAVGETVEGMVAGLMTGGGAGAGGGGGVPRPAAAAAPGGGGGGGGAVAAPAVAGAGRG